MTDPGHEVLDLAPWAPVSCGPATEHRHPVVVAFDVDRTVTTGDCVVPFLRQVAGTVGLVGHLIGSARRLLSAAARRDRDALKAVAARATFAGRPIGEIETAATAFATRIEQTLLRPDTVARLRWHRAAGHTIVFVSASFAVYLRPLAERLGVDGVIATELVVGSDGRCTGELLGGNCRGPAKVERFHAWLDAHRGGRAAVAVWAYGDSSGDRELLADADHGVWAHDRLTVVPGSTP
jgi:phosphatidylglycerophosphatase C